MDTSVASFDQVTYRRHGTGLIMHDPTRSAGGYTLFAPLSDNGNVYLIDISGDVVHQWKMPNRPGRHAVLLANGNLAYNGNHPHSDDLYPAWDMWHGGVFSEVTPRGEVVWSYEDARHHHDAHWCANGDLLYAVAEEMPRAVAERIAGGSHEHDLAGGTHFGDVVKRVDRAGKLVWEWRSWEHLNPSEFPIHAIFDRYHWPLINGLSITHDGLVLMSLRTTSGVIAVDPAGGEVVWKIRHPDLAQQHDPVPLANGNVLIFDNGNLRPGVTIPHSRVVEFAPNGGHVVWQYRDPVICSFFAPFMGSADRLANGNTLIAESSSGRLFEVTPNGVTVWEYVVPQFAEYSGAARAYSPGAHNGVFKVRRYARERIPWL